MAGKQHVKFQARLVGGASLMDISGRYTARAAGRLQPKSARASVSGSMRKTSSAARNALKTS